MNVLVTLEHRFEQTPDGCVWTQAAFARSFYSQYLEVFEGAKIIARVRPVQRPSANAKRADGDGVSFHALPCYVGPREFILRSREVRLSARASIKEQNHAVVLRVGSQIASCIEPALYRSRRPYALEAMCDPHEIFAPGCNDHPLRPIFRMLFSRRMKQQCRRAPAISYVTERFLQQRYPAAPRALSVSYSDVELPVDAYAAVPRAPRKGGPSTVITVGSLEQPYKGVDLLIDAVKANVRSGLALRLVVIGDGRYRPELEARARELKDRVKFTGWVPTGSEVREHLDGADLFVLASRTEGLPRALAEAMARALPCIGSDVGGIPELLPSSDLVPAGNAVALAAKIEEVIASPDRMASMSARNLKRAEDFQTEILRRRRNDFYSELKLRTEEWLRKTGSSRS